MATEMFTSGASSGLRLDPRTKLFMLIMVCFVILGGGRYDGFLWIPVVFMALPLVMMLSSKRWGYAMVYACFFAVCYALECFLLPYMTGALCFLIMFCVYTFGRIIPSCMMGLYLMSTTTSSEFMAGMEKMHIPTAVTIPLSVIFRFFPTILEENRSIGDAMKMRGIRLSGRKSGKILEYRLMPLMVSCAKIGDELSQAALTRGLCGESKRTHICTVKFGVLDYICCGLMLICLIIIILSSANVI